MNGETLDKLKELSIFLPAIHILMCFSYLLFYYMSFGFGIHVFSSPADIFAISLGELLPNYVFLFLGILVGVGHGKLISSVNVDITADENYSLELSKFSRFIMASKKNPHMFVALIGFAMIVLLSIFSAVIFYVKTGFTSYLFVEIVLIAGWIIIHQIFVRKSINNKLHGEIMFYGVFVFLLTITGGLEKGQHDRHYGYSRLEADSPKCREFIVLRSLSDNFLAVGKDNARLIIDRKCNILFTLFDASKFDAFPFISVIDLLRD